MEQGLAVALIDVINLEALPNDSPRHLHVMPVVVEKILEDLSGEFETEFEGLDQTGALQIVVTPALTGLSELGEGPSEAVESLQPALFPATAHGPPPPERNDLRLKAVSRVLRVTVQLVVQISSGVATRIPTPVDRIGVLE